MELVCVSNFGKKLSSEITTIDNFQSIENIFEYFDSAKISSLISENDKVFLFKLQIKEAEHAPSSSDFHKLAKTFSICSVVIFLSTENGKRFFLYWKSNKIQHFLIFKIYDRADFMHQFRVFDFIAIFLGNSLRSGHLGKIVTDY